MSSKLKTLVTLFTRVTTGILIVTAIFVSVFWGVDHFIGVEVLWQILIVSAVCTVGSVVFFIGNEKEVSKWEMFARMIAYYVYINIVVLGLGWKFNWYLPDNLVHVISMVLGIAAVFGVVSAVSYWAEFRVAEKMNEKLRER